MKRTLGILFFLGTQVFGIQEVQFWHSMTGPKGKILEGIVSDFNALPENQGHRKVILQFVGNYPEGMNKLRTALLGGKEPGVAQIYDIGTRTMIDSGATVPLEHFLEKDPDLKKSDILPEIRRYYEVGGQLHSLPFATSNPIIYYNKDALAEGGVTALPTTFAELEKTAKQLSDPKTQMTGITWPLHAWFFEQFIARQGLDLLDEHNGRAGRAGKANLTEPAAIRFVSLWARMVKDKSFAHVGRGWDPAMHNFLAGRSAMFITSTSEVFDIQKQAAFPVGTAALPTQDPKVAGGTVVGGNALWILKKKNTAEEDAAFRFVKYMGSFDAQKKWHTSTGYFPIRQDVMDHLQKEGFYEKYPSAWTAVQQLRASASISATQGALASVLPEARENIESAIEKVLAGISSPEEALQEAKTKTERSLARDNALKVRLVAE